MLNLLRRGLPRFALLLLGFAVVHATESTADPRAAPHPVPLQFGMNPLTWADYVRTPDEHHPHLSFFVGGEAAASVRAARIFIDHAVDDTGHELRAAVEPKFTHVAVGRISEAELRGPLAPQIETNLTAVGPGATKIKKLRGRVQLAIPAMSPDATVVIDNLSARFGQPIDAPPLARAHVVLHLFGPGQAAAAAAIAQIENISFGEAHLSAAQLAQLSDFARAQMLRRPVAEIGPTDILLAISDPEDRLVGVEFTADDGAPLIYNRNGFAHIENNGCRLSSYHLDRAASAGIKLVCSLALDGAIAEIPLIMDEVPLPPLPAPANALAPAPTPATAENR